MDIDVAQYGEIVEVQIITNPFQATPVEPQDSINLHKWVQLDHP